MGRVDVFIGATEIFLPFFAGASDVGAAAGTGSSVVLHSLLVLLLPLMQVFFGRCSFSWWWRRWWRTVAAADTGTGTGRTGDYPARELIG